jgi:hypothetical protein
VLCLWFQFKYNQKFTEDDEEFVKLILAGMDHGSIPNMTIRKIKQDIEKEIEPLKILGILRTHIKPAMLESRTTGNELVRGKKEVILSEYLLGEK